MPAALASSTAYWIRGLSTTGSISFGIALVAGRKRAPRPPTGKMALRTGLIVMLDPCDVKGAFVPQGLHLDNGAAGRRRLITQQPVPRFVQARSEIGRPTVIG